VPELGPDRGDVRGDAVHNEQFINRHALPVRQ
jgi:hypothetical protein